VYKPRPFEDLQTGPGTAAGYRPAAADERHPATMSDNPALLRVNPEYLAWLLSLPTLERERLLGGNWKIRPAAGVYFKREWCSVVDQVPADLDIVRYWDLRRHRKNRVQRPGLDRRLQARPRSARDPRASETAFSSGPPF